MRGKFQTKTIVILAFLLMSFSVGYAELYSGGPWRGRVIDADTKEPIEGAVVVAIWERAYDGHPAGSQSFFHDAREILTDKEGRFDMPAYVVKSEDANLFREKDLEKIGLMKMIITGPTIREPTFIVYKPSYGNYPHQDVLFIYPVEPSSKVEYQEEHKEMYQGRLVTAWAKKKIKTFSEGLAYAGRGCKAKVDALAGTLPFSFGSLFLPMEKSKERIENLDVPLACPDNGEPIPGSQHGFRDDTVGPLHSNKGGFVIIELPRLKTKEERLKAITYPYGDVTAKDIPLLYKAVNEERRRFGLGLVGE